MRLLCNHCSLRQLEVGAFKLLCNFQRHGVGSEIVKRVSQFHSHSYCLRTSFAGAKEVWLLLSTVKIVKLQANAWSFTMVHDIGRVSGRIIRTKSGFSAGKNF